MEKDWGVGEKEECIEEVEEWRGREWRGREW